MPSWARRAAAVIPSGSSTGSKRMEAIYGAGETELPTHFARASGCRIVTAGGVELIDCTMALGAVGFGYADPEVTARVEHAVRNGNVCGLAPTLEVEIAERLARIIPCAEQVRFLKTGAEAVAAAVRVARAFTGRRTVIGSGYFGWLDWASDADGVPAGVRSDFSRVPFDDADALEQAVHAAGDRLAAIVLEPVIERAPDPDWLRAARSACDATGAVLVFDEMKTGFRVAPGGYQERSGITPDLAIFGKAMANGFPLAALAGRARVMHALERTWVSSTLASETVALAAAVAVIDRHEKENVSGAMAANGHAMRDAVERAIASTGISSVSTAGIPEMWLLRFDDEAQGARFVRHAVEAGVLFKRGAYNFGSLAHHPGEVAAIGRAAEAAFARLREEHA